MTVPVRLAGSLILFALVGCAAAPGSSPRGDETAPDLSGPRQDGGAPAPQDDLAPPDLLPAADVFPRLVLRAEGIAKIQAALAAAVEPTTAAFAQLRGDAEEGLARTPQAPVDFNVPGYYFDKEGHRAAKAALAGDGGAAYALALGAALLPSGAAERPAWIAHAITLVDAWSATNRSVSGFDGPLVMAYKGIYLLLAADLLMAEPAWSPAARHQFSQWVETVFVPAMDTIKTKPDNWGCWGRLGALAAARLLGDGVGALGEADALRDYLEVAIAPNGELVEENKRHVKGMKYTFFALAPLTVAAQIVRTGSLGDLFNHTTPSGRSLRLALDKYFGYAVAPESWPYTTPTDPLEILMAAISPSALEVELPTQTDWPANLFEAVSAVYQQPAWESWAAVGRPLRGSELWTYATLLRPALK